MENKSDETTFMIYRMFEHRFWNQRRRSLSLAAHHVHEFVKVEGSGAVLIHLIDDTFDVFFRKPVVQLPQDLLEHLGGDVSVALLVVYSESFLELFLQGFFIFLNKEFGGKDTKLFELKLTGTILVDFIDDFLERLLGHLEAHHPEDGRDGVDGDVAQLLRVERVERLPQGGNLIFVEFIHVRGSPATHSPC